jgi:circadian clock protein KaiB
MTAPAEFNCDLTLFVSGSSHLSIRAIGLARDLCDVHLRGRSHLTIINVYEHPELGDGVALPTPTLVKNLPLPVRRVVGDLSDADKVLLALDLCPAASDATGAG